jgi:hypothetical protein
VSARGYEESNKFQVVVLNRTVGRECTTEGSKYGVEGDCGAFKECVDGKLVVRKCDADVERPQFDVVSMECTDAEEAECFVASKGVHRGSRGLKVWASFDNINIIQNISKILKINR